MCIQFFVCFQKSQKTSSSHQATFKAWFVCILLGFSPEFLVDSYYEPLARWFMIHNQMPDYFYHSQQYQKCAFGNRTRFSTHIQYTYSTYYLACRSYMFSCNIIMYKNHLHTLKPSSLVLINAVTYVYDTYVCILCSYAIACMIRD